MNAQEAAALCRLAKAACPQQAVDELTPDAWALVLDDIRFEDAKAALIAIVKEQPFVAPAEIRSKVRAIRNDRLLHMPHIDPPPGIADDERAYRRWLLETRRRYADGDDVGAGPALPRRDMRVIEGAFKTPDDARWRDHIVEARTALQREFEETP